MRKKDRVIIPTLHIVTSSDDESFISIMNSNDEPSISNISEHTLSSFIEPILYQTSLYSPRKQLKSPHSISHSSVVSDYQYPLSDSSTSSIHTEYSFDFQIPNINNDDNDNDNVKIHDSKKEDKKN